MSGYALHPEAYAGSKKQGGAFVPPYFGGMYAPSGQGRRHAELRHVCATPDCFSWDFAGRRPHSTYMDVVNPDVIPIFGFCPLCRLYA